MPNCAHALLITALLSCSCGRSAAPESRKLCEALAITAEALTNESLKHATDEYAAADRAMKKWEQWDANKVTQEQNGTGEYSGAWQRAQTYARAGNAFCDAARVQAWELVELARLTGDRNVLDAAHRLTIRNHFCMWRGDDNVNERKASLGDWERRRSEPAAAARDSEVS